MKRVRIAVSALVTTLIVISQMPGLRIGVWQAFDAAPSAHAAAVVSVTKSAPSQAHPGQTAQYSIVVRNNDTINVTGELEDPVMTFTPHLTLIPAQSNSPTHPGVQCAQDPNGLVSCSPVTLSPGQFATYILTFNVSANAPCTGSYSNSANFEMDAGAGTVSSNTTTTSFTCPPQVDLKIEKTGPSTVAPGGVIVYTVSAVHVSGGTATNVIVQDPLPSGAVTFNPGQSDASCHIDSGLIVCSTPSLAPGARKDFAIAFTVSTNAACNSVISNTAAICKSDQDDPNPSNDVFNGSVSTTVTCPPQGADVSVVKTGTTTVTAGGVASYTVTATNAGPGPATNVVIADVVPAAGLAFNSTLSSAGCVLNGNQTSVLCNNFNLSPGQSRSFTIAFNVPLPAQCSPYVINNKATVSTSTTDNNPANNISQTISTSVTCPVTPPQCSDGVDNSDPEDTLADFNDPGCYTNGVYNPNDNDETDNALSANVGISKTGPSSVTRGDVVSYGVSVTNAGPNAATNVVVSDAIPSGLIFNASLSSAGCVLNGSQTSVLCNNFNLAVNETRTFTIAFNVPTVSACSTGSVQNQATVSTSTTDPVSSNNTSNTVTTTINCPVPTQTTLTLQKSAPTTIQRPGTVSYTVVVSNTGPIAAQNAVVTDPVPFGLTFQPSGSHSACALQGSDVVCSVGTLPAGLALTLTINFTAASADPCSQTTVQNRAFVTSNQSSFVQSQTVSTTITCPQSTNADVSVQKTGPLSVNAGATFSYTVTAFNAGPAVATGVAIADVIPSGLTFNAAGSSQGCVLNGAGTSVICSGFSLNANETRVFTLSFVAANPSQCVQTTVQNQATISTTSTDPVSSNNVSQTVSTTVQCNTTLSPDVTVEKTGPSTVIRGNTITYVLTARNIGGATANGVVVTDTLPSGLTFTSSGTSGACTAAGNVVTCNVGTLAAGASTILSINATTTAVTDPCSQTTVTNTASITTTSVESNSTNNQSQSVPTVLQCPTIQFTIQKTDNRTTVQPGEVVTYSITVQNLSSTTATNVTVTDILPSQVSFLSASDGGFMSGQTATWNGLTVAANSSRILTLTALVSSSASNGSFITNTATVGGVSATDSTQVQTGTTTPNLSVNITDSPDPIDAGAILTYTIQVQNLNSTAATGLTMTQSLPSNVQFLSATDGGYQASVVWNNLTIAGNSSRIFTVTVRVFDSVTDGSSLLTSITIGNASDSETTLVRSTGSQNLQVDVTDSPDPVCFDDEISYTIALRNDGSQSDIVDIRAALDSRTDFVSAEAGGREISNSQVRWDSIYVAAHSTEFVTLRVRVNGNVSSNDSLRLRVTVDNDTDTETTYVRRDCGIPRPPVYPPIYPPVPPVPPLPLNAAVYLSKQADRNEAQPGDTVYYSVTVRNTGNIPAIGFTIEDTYPSNKMTVSDAAGAIMTPGRIVWNVQTLGPNETRTFTYRGTVNWNLRQGDDVLNTARASGGNLTTGANASVDVRIVMELPRTGIEDFARPFSSLTAFLSPMGGDSSSATLPSIVWGAIMLMGLAAGGGIGRRYLI